MKHHKTFQGGLALRPDRQETGALPIETLPAPPVVTIPLLQHAGGVPARPIVKTGDHVSMGQMIGIAENAASAAVHASVSGTVTNISRYPYSADPAALMVTIENDGDDEFASPIPYDKTWQDSSPGEMIAKILLSGVIDFNGTAVPAHIKLGAARNTQPESLIMNAMATEPFANADQQLLIEQTEKVLTGGLICKKIIGAERFSIVINEKNGIVEQTLAALIADERFKDLAVIKLRPRYPQHEESLMARVVAATPAAGKRCVVLCAASAAYIRDAVMECVPWYQRIVTVAGPAAGSPKNLLVRIGSPIAPLLEAGSVDLAKTKKIVSGGLLSGKTVSTIDAPVTKSTSALIALNTTYPGSGGSACINCGRCMAVCPMRLAPMRLALLAQRNDTAEAQAWHIDDCIDCGCCAYVCPATINLVHFIQYGKKLSGLRKEPKVLV